MTTATETKSRPIIMDAESVRAILDGRKSVTRRVVKPQPEWSGSRWVWPLPKRVHHLMGPGTTSVCSGSREWHEYMPPGCCPYGSPGDLLYVRETWRYYDWTEDGLPWIQYRADHATRLHDSGNIPEEWADRLTDTWAELSDPENYARQGRAADQGWRSPIYMPKWAARLWLRVTDVRVERVQEISAPDALAEGCGVEPCARCDEQGCEDCAHEGWHSEVSRFRDRWDALNAKRGYPWDENPWVWVIEFELAEAP